MHVLPVRVSVGWRASPDPLSSELDETNSSAYSTLQVEPTTSAVLEGDIVDWTDSSCKRTAMGDSSSEK